MGYAGADSARPVSPLSCVANFMADRFANRHDALVNDAVKNLDTIAALAQNASLVQRIEVLRHVGLGGFDLGQQVTHIFFLPSHRQLMI